MFKRFSKLLAFLLFLAMVIGTLPLSAAALEDNAVTSVEDLITAIENSNDMDTVFISGDIKIAEPITIGVEGKTVVLCGKDGETASITITESIETGAEVTFQCLTLAGSSEQSSGIIIQQLGACNTRAANLSFLYSTGSSGESAYYAKTGLATFEDCNFEGCQAENGSFIRSDSGATISVDGCTFSAGIASGNGGAIYALGELSINNSRFLNSHADINGGAIYSAGFLNITTSEFDGSDAQNGGMIFCCGIDAVIEECAFDRGYAEQCGGQIYGLQLQIASSQMVGGSADIDGGSIYVDSDAVITDCTVIQNRSARCGGGIWSRQNLTLHGCKVFNNTAESSGADIWCMCGLSILDTAPALLALFESELSDGVWNTVGWYSDKEFERYSVEQLTQRLTIPCESLQAPEYITFAMYYEEPAPEPLAPQPEDSSNDEGSSHSPGSRPEPAPQPDTISVPLACGNAVLSKPTIRTFCDVIPRFIPLAKGITREEMAGFLYGMLSDESRTANIPDVGRFTDTEQSPYQEAIKFLSTEGVFAGSGNKKFNPTAPLSWAQMITVFARFAKNQFAESTPVSNHWASQYISIAFSAEWIDELPTDLDVSVTCGEMVRFLSGIVGTE